MTSSSMKISVHFTLLIDENRVHEVKLCFLDLILVKNLYTPCIERVSSQYDFVISVYYLKISL